MERKKWYLVNTVNQKHMIVWNVKNEEEAIIICKAYIIRNDLGFDLEVKSIVEIKNMTDDKLYGITDIILACN